MKEGELYRLMKMGESHLELEFVHDEQAERDVVFAQVVRQLPVGWMLSTTGQDWTVWDAQNLPVNTDKTPDDTIAGALDQDGADGWTHPLNMPGPQDWVIKAEDIRRRMEELQQEEEHETDIGNRGVDASTVADDDAGGRVGAH